MQMAWCFALLLLPAASALSADTFIDLYVTGMNAWGPGALEFFDTSYGVYHNLNDPSGDCAQKTFKVPRRTVGGALAYPSKISDHWQLGGCPGTWKYFWGNCPSLTWAEKTLTIVSAQYGGNIGSGSRVTDHVKGVCAASGDQGACGYTVDAAVIGDPYPGQQKEFKITYYCDPNTVQYATLPAEANGHTLVIACDPPPAPISVEGWCGWYDVPSSQHKANDEQTAAGGTKTAGLRGEHEKAQL
eukprot:TRINITY_DN67768_c10_g9_i1.p1 TRINITY_DN67768_c10_g9~~TRINITY_DN67768_c10_g9_i1.p1  ORF type:complete len:244 (+),score=12.05 TRINITY_DN67768_c10_g9_i1:123-854(+)